MHTAILISVETNTNDLIHNLLGGKFAEFDRVDKKGVGIFSTSEVARFIEEEERHGQKELSANSVQSLKSMSSGERKFALFNYLVHSAINTLILVNPYDNLDAEKVTELKRQLESLSDKIQFIQLLTRASDALTTTKVFYRYSGMQLTKSNSPISFSSIGDRHQNTLGEIPPALHPIQLNFESLVVFKNINVSFDGRQVLKNIDWEIKTREFWKLKGPNGSGKSTLLNMITAESHKGYGQDLTLFGKKKGSGESVWDLKELLGYFTPAMVDRFRGYHSVENMLISGLHDSVGLYQKPSKAEKDCAETWLRLLGMQSKKNQYFNQLSLGEKRLIMTARAMIKHPPLLILDEPTVGLDDSSASFFVELVNTFAEQSKTTLLYVSHRNEAGLRPKKVFELIPTSDGSIGKIIYI